MARGTILAPQAGLLIRHAAEDFQIVFEKREIDRVDEKVIHWAVDEFLAFITQKLGALTVCVQNKPLSRDLPNHNRKQIPGFLVEGTIRRVGGNGIRDAGKREGSDGGWFGHGKNVRRK
jgi:hypothetical protein